MLPGGGGGEWVSLGEEGNAGSRALSAEEGRGTRLFYDHPSLPQESRTYIRTHTSAERCGFLNPPLSHEYVITFSPVGGISFCFYSFSFSQEFLISLSDKSGWFLWTSLDFSKKTRL